MKREGVDRRNVEERGEEERSSALPASHSSGSQLQRINSPWPVRPVEQHAVTDTCLRTNKLIPQVFQKCSSVVEM